MKHGTFILLIGPTGSGKSMLMKHAISVFPELVLPFSYTTRPRRHDAIENAHYKFLSEEEFKQWIDEGKFLEWAEYSGNYYGTLRAEVEAALAEGKTLLKEMEVQGVRQIRETLPKEQLLTVFISAGSWDALEARIRARAPISDEEVALRRKRYEDEITFKDEADVCIENIDGNKEFANKAFTDLIQSVVT
jgi:guanylate kinase